MYIDKEYAMLEMLSENEGLSQRQLSRLLDISLGSVNMLINKMQREGLIKFRNISANSVAYILTPEGIAEKAQKTYRYVTYHYKRINDTKNRIKEYLEKKSESVEKIYLVLDDSEMSEIVLLAVQEMKNDDAVEILRKEENQVDNFDTNTYGQGNLFLLIKNEDKERFEGKTVEMLLESL